MTIHRLAHPVYSPVGIAIRQIDSGSNLVISIPNLWKNSTDTLLCPPLLYKIHSDLPCWNPGPVFLVQSLCIFQNGCPTLATLTFLVSHFIKLHNLFLFLEKVSLAELSDHHWILYPPGVISLNLSLWDFAMTASFTFPAFLFSQSHPAYFPPLFYLLHSLQLFFLLQYLMSLLFLIFPFFLPLLTIFFKIHCLSLWKVSGWSAPIV